MPVRFGVTVAPDLSPAVWRDKVRALDDSPVDVLLVNDHLTGLRYAPMVALAAAAEHSTRLRLGTVVLANDYRHPTILAKEAATLDLLSEGRLELGIGAGWMRSDYDQAGLPFDPPGVRLARLREAVDVLRGAWSDKPFSYYGDHYRADELDFAPRPVQRPHPPLLLGGGGRVMLRFAAREADIVNITNQTAADGRGVAPADVGLAPLLAKLALVREAAAERPVPPRGVCRRPRDSCRPGSWPGSPCRGRPGRRVAGDSLSAGGQCRRGHRPGPVLASGARHLLLHPRQRHRREAHVPGHGARARNCVDITASSAHG